MKAQLQSLAQTKVNLESNSSTKIELDVLKENYFDGSLNIEAIL